MRARLWKVGRGLIWLLLLPFRLILWPFWQAALLGGRFLRWTGRQLWSALKAVGRFVWELWEPIHELLAYYFLTPLQDAWQGIGNMGLAIRHLLVAFIWQPLVWVTAPFRWLLWQLFRLVRWIARQVWRFMLWGSTRLWRIGVALFTLFVLRPQRWLTTRIIRQWQAGQPARHRFRRNLISFWTVQRARLWLTIRRPAPPATAIIAPPRPPPGNSVSRDAPGPARRYPRHHQRCSGWSELHGQ